MELGLIAMVPFGKAKATATVTFTPGMDMSVSAEAEAEGAASSSASASLTATLQGDALRTDPVRNHVVVASQAHAGQL